MKKTLLKSAIALSILFATISTSAFAGNTNPVTDLTVVGTIQSQPVYELRINNEAYGEYTIVITDEFGVVLHEETVKGVNISRKYQIDTAELGTTGVRFEVVAVSHKSTFKVKNNVVSKEYDTTTSITKK